MNRWMLVTLSVMALSTAATGQERRPASPAGHSATQVGGRHDERLGYVGGRWIEVRYGRPIKRNRDLFGPADHADWLGDGGPVWRAGANASTRLITEAPLVIADATVARGEYTLFIDLTTEPWTLIVSTWPAQTTYDFENHDALWGAYEYTPDHDVVRVPMNRETLSRSHDQLSWQFVDMSNDGGTLAIFWDREFASVPFSVSR
jgi:hypothetical protein